MGVYKRGYIKLTYPSYLPILWRSPTISFLHKFMSSEPQRETQVYHFAFRWSDSKWDSEYKVPPHTYLSPCERYVYVWDKGLIRHDAPAIVNPY